MTLPSYSHDSESLAAIKRLSTGLRQVAPANAHATSYGDLCSLPSAEGGEPEAHRWCGEVLPMRFPLILLRRRKR